MGECGTEDDCCLPEERRRERRPLQSNIRHLQFTFDKLSVQASGRSDLYMMEEPTDNRPNDSHQFNQRMTISLCVVPSYYVKCLRNGRP